MIGLWIIGLVSAQEFATGNGSAKTVFIETVFVETMSAKEDAPSEQRWVHAGSIPEQLASTPTPYQPEQG